MRVVKNKSGQFAIDDSPMRLSGTAAEQFLAEMNRKKSSNPNAERTLAAAREIANKRKPN